MKPIARLHHLGILFTCVFGIVLFNLFQVSVVDHDTWLLRSYRNRWAFKDVPVQRGAIVDRDGQVLARDVPCFRLEGYYREFRRGHPAGLAVHGAGMLQELLAQTARGNRAGGDRTGGFAGSPQSRPRLDVPEQVHGAMELLLALPIGNLFAAEGSALADAGEEPLRDLRFYTLGLLRALHQGRWRGLSEALRQLAGRAPGTPVASAYRAVAQELGLVGTDLQAAFRNRVEEWFALDRQMGALWRGRTLSQWFEIWRGEYEATRLGEEDGQPSERLRLLAP